MQTLRDYLVKFSVNGHRTEQIVSARSSLDAKRLIEAQYAGQKIVFYSCTQA